MSDPDPNDILLVFSAPPLSGADERPARAAQALEEVFPSQCLRYEARRPSDGEAGVDLVPIEDRAAWLSATTERGRVPLITNGDQDHFISMVGHAWPPVLGPGRQAILHFICNVPDQPPFVDRIDDLLAAIGVALSAYSGYATPFKAGALLGQQIIHPGSDGKPPSGLPALRPARELAGPEVPQRLGWVNYWCAATAALLHFPDPHRDLELLSRAHPTEGGRWTVRLTDEPLDLARPDHVKTLLRAYERFPEIGRLTGQAK
jgi:uncharacterized protein DUF5953